MSSRQYYGLIYTIFILYIIYIINIYTYSTLLVAKFVQMVPQYLTVWYCIVFLYYGPLKRLLSCQFNLLPRWNSELYVDNVCMRGII